MPNIFDRSRESSLPNAGPRAARDITQAERRADRRSRWGEREGVKRRRSRRAKRRSGRTGRIEGRRPGGSRTIPQPGRTLPVVMNKGGLVTHKSIYDMEKGG